jgi:hypothetical protein
MPSSDSYFCYYRRLVENSRTWSTMKTHNNIIDLVRLLKQPEATRESVQNILRKRLLDEELEEADEILEDSINLVVRLLLMVSTGGFLSARCSLIVSGETKISMYTLSPRYSELISPDWKHGTIKCLVRTQFATQRTMKESVKLEKFFNARNLEHTAGIKVRWTSNQEKEFLTLKLIQFKSYPGRLRCACHFN